VVSEQWFQRRLLRGGLSRPGRRFSWCGLQPTKLTSSMIKTIIPSSADLLKYLLLVDILSLLNLKLKNG